ncbi:MAG: bifunctional nuclease family protein, partial [Bacteroidota bacterium]
MKKIELNIIAITNSESHLGQFALVLEDVEMKRRIPITIGSVEAQAIAMVVEKMKPLRPQTHDLFYNSIITLGMTIEEVVINEIIEDRYHSKIVFKKGDEKIAVDSRT